MEMILWFIGAIVIGGVIFAFQQQAVTQPGRDLAKKFAALGTIAGRSKQEIIQAVGQPSSFSALAENQTLLQWQATGYHIALSFTGEVCNGVTHEHLAQ
nr:hypothetical protein [uncultured bacterium]